MLFLWIALGDLDMTTLWKTLQTARWEPVAVGIAFYWLALALKVKKASDPAAVLTAATPALEKTTAGADAAWTKAGLTGCTG